MKGPTNKHIIWTQLFITLNFNSLRKHSIKHKTITIYKINLTGQINVVARSEDITKIRFLVKSPTWTSGTDLWPPKKPKPLQIAATTCRCWQVRLQWSSGQMCKSSSKAKMLKKIEFHFKRAASARQVPPKNSFSFPLKSPLNLPLEFVINSEEKFPCQDLSWILLGPQLPKTRWPWTQLAARACGCQSSARRATLQNGSVQKILPETSKWITFLGSGANPTDFQFKIVFMRQAKKDKSVIGMPCVIFSIAFRANYQTTEFLIWEVRLLDCQTLTKSICSFRITRREGSTTFRGSRVNPTSFTIRPRKFGRSFRWLMENRSSELFIRKKNFPSVFTSGQWKTKLEKCSANWNWQK